MHEQTLKKARSLGLALDIQQKPSSLIARKSLTKVGFKSPSLDRLLNRVGRVLRHLDKYLQPDKSLAQSRIIHTPKLEYNFSQVGPRAIGYNFPIQQFQNLEVA